MAAKAAKILSATLLSITRNTWASFYDATASYVKGADHGRLKMAKQNWGYDKGYTRYEWKLRERDAIPASLRKFIGKAETWGDFVRVDFNAVVFNDKETRRYRKPPRGRHRMPR
jgi:hypothetical protein